MKLKTYAFSAFLSLGVGVSYAQNVGIGISAPDASAKMDITATDRGVLIPRVALTMTTASAPVTSPANSLLVYNTATAGDVTPGFYYWNSTTSAWTRLSEGKAGWEITGNNGITAANFLGTINAADLNIHTSGFQRMVVASGGNVGIGDGTPAALFTVGAGDLFQVVNTGHARGIFGTAALPSFSFVNDTDNGMYRSAVNELSFSTAATQRAVISSAGLVGINAATPATYLDINGDLAYREGAALVLANGANATVAPGTTSHVRITGPTAAFSVAGFSGGVNGKILTIINTTTQQMTILNNGAVTATNGIYAPNAANLVLDGQYASVTVQYNSSLGRWVVLSYSKKEGTDWLLTGNTGTNDPAVPVAYGTSTIGAAENWMGTQDANDIVFGTNNIERLRIKQTNGNVGIGTAAPSEQLHVYEINDASKSSIFSYATQISTGTDYQNRAVVGIAKGGNATWGYAFGVSGVADQANSWFATGVYAGLGTTAPATISSDQALYADGNSLGQAGIFMNGNVGISTASPAERLHVVGNIRTSSLAGVGNRMVMSDANGTLINLANGVNNQVLTMVAGAPAWSVATVATGNGLSFGTAAPVLNEVILGGTLEQATTVTQSTFNMNWNLNSTGDFLIQDNGSSVFQVNDALEAVFNEASLDYDFRVESDARTHAMWADANENLVRFGTNWTGSDWGNAATVAGVVVDYVADFDNDFADGTAIGIGSVEYILDLLSETAINNDFSPTANITYDLGGTYSWDDVYADDFWNVSDARLKTEIKDVNYGLAQIMKLHPVSYKWKQDYKGKTYIPLEEREQEIGFLAQEVLQTMPELVQTEDWKVASEETPDEFVKKQREYMAVNYVGMVPVLVKAIQEQQAQIEALKKEIETLKNK